MKRAVILLASLALIPACLQCPTPMGTGGGGGGGGEPTSTTSTTSGACIPVKDNDPVACSANHCTMAPDGCGGVIHCDTMCNTSPTPASCGMPKGTPECVPCVASPDLDHLCTTPTRQYAYQCLWQYPQPAACDAKSTDGKNFVACCGGPI